MMQHAGFSRFLKAATACALAATLMLVTAGCQRQTGPVVRLEPANPLPEPKTTYLDLGIQLLRVNQNDLARKAFIRSIRMEGATPEAFSGAGVAAERKNLLGEAQRFFEQAHKLAPESVLTNNNLGAIHYRLGDYHSARRAFQAAFAISSGESDISKKNLALTNIAIERENERYVDVVRNPVLIQRLGTGVYKLGTGEQTEG